MFVFLLLAGVCWLVAHAHPEWRAWALAAAGAHLSAARAAADAWCAELGSALYANVPDLVLEGWDEVLRWWGGGSLAAYKALRSLLAASRALFEVVVSYFAILDSVLDFANEFTEFVVVCLRYVRDSQKEFVEVHDFVRFFQNAWEYFTHQSSCKRLYFFVSTDSLFGVQSGRRLREEMWKFLPRLGWIYFVLLTFYYYVKFVVAAAYGAAYAVAARRIALHQPPFVPALALVLRRAQELRQTQAAAPALAAPAVAAPAAQARFRCLRWVGAGLAHIACRYTLPVLANLAFAFLMFCMHSNAVQRGSVVMRKVTSNDTWTYGVVAVFGAEMTCEQTMSAWGWRVFSGSWAFY